MAVEKIKEVQELNGQIEDEVITEPDNLESISELPLEIVLEMAKEPNAEGPILEMAVEKIKEVLELNGKSEDNIKPDDKVSLTELPLEMVLEMAKDTNAEENILEMAVEKIEEKREKIKEIQELNGHSEGADETDDLVSISELPLEMVLEMAKNPKAEETILEMAVEKIKEVREHNGKSEDHSEADDKVSISALPIEMVLEMAKDTNAEENLLEMAVEKIKERREKIKEIKELNGQSEDTNETDDLVSISELPLEMVLEMAKDPNAEETILEMAVEKIKEVQVLNGQSKDADESDLVSISELPIEMVLEMAKHPKADGHILEMAVEKIKGVQELNGQGEYKPYVYASEPSSIDVPESLAGALPMEILLEMAKDPEAKEQILDMAMERLKELPEPNLETEEELVALEPIAVDMSELPIEIILEMAKDAKAEGHILEMAMEKIKEVQDQSEAKPEETKPTSIQVPD